MRYQLVDQSSDGSVLTIMCDVSDTTFIVRLVNVPAYPHEINRAVKDAIVAHQVRCVPCQVADAIAEATERPNRNTP